LEPVDHLVQHHIREKHTGLGIERLDFQMQLYHLFPVSEKLIAVKFSLHRMQMLPACPVFSRIANEYGNINNFYTVKLGTKY
jgi:hypothetical protein